MQIRFKSNLRDWLQENRWKPKEFADRLGVKRQSVHNWMDGKITPRRREIIHQLYELGGEELIEFSNPVDRPFKKKSAGAYFEIKGGTKLTGEIEVSGSKNAALPMLCAALLTDEKCVFRNVPEISDIAVLLEIFKEIGVSVSRDLENKTVEIQARNIDPTKLKNCRSIKKMRASLLIIGPLLARFGEVEILPPGGCILGARSNEVHLNAFKILGVEDLSDDAKISLKFERKNFANSQVLFPEASVTATENVAIFCAGVADNSELFFTAAENHVTATLKMLQQMGVEIEGIGTHRLKICGTRNLRGGVFEIPSDGILAGTYAVMGVLTGGDLTLRNVYHTELLSFYGALRRTGASFEFSDDTLHIFGTQKLHAIPKIQTAIYPGFPTDLQSLFGVLLTQCDGESLIFETLFENRFTYLAELEKMGARVKIQNPHQAKIFGPTRLRGTEVQSWDLRAGAAMVLAGLVAEGTTRVSNIDYIDRGYENFCENLQSLGARIRRVEE